ncbi:hypothetical protein OGAPHI_005442 [Ogataea philodendri]|uniref:Crh-like protein n=1 Tax=Ogataea philodendri TaxID=1378263 RepID=A0A9P8T1I7_9ASCO|nr:uncharacterized protein OGAPHI_005442 [Ogataea philodendri]KAH3662194.1 hypothetical protein OGAPHI_005442 [Ogataea philodendri]
MRPQLFTNALLGGLVAGLASATASSSVSLATATCNPLKSTGCPADPALASSVVEDFKSQSDHFSVYSTPDQIFYTDEGLKLTLAKRFDNPSLRSNFYIMFGKIEVLLKAANGTGVISSFYLQSDDLDEVDLEWFGGDGYEVQTNYFSKGNTATYDRGGYHKMDDPRSDYHNYTIDWTSEALTWYVDGQAIRTLTNDSSQGYPQSPMYLMMGIWAGGDSSNSQGTIEWAGGSTNYDDAPFSMYIKNLVVVDYSTGSEYRYGDTSGSWTSVDAVDGEVNGRQEKADAEFEALVSGDSVDDEDEDDSTTLSGGSLSRTDSSASASEDGSHFASVSSVASGSIPSSKRSITSDTQASSAATTLKTVNSASSLSTSAASSSYTASASSGAGTQHTVGLLNLFASFVSAGLVALTLI